MNFVSYAFLGLFLVALLVRVLPLSKRAYLWSLIVISTVFYAWQAPGYLAVIYGIIIFDFTVGLALRSELLDYAGRKHMASLSILANAILLIWFKYKLFMLTSARAVLGAMGFHLGNHSGSMDVVSDSKSDLPLGVSFHTFQSMAYNVDILRGVHGPVTRLRDFMFTVIFFPQLVAGPIVRPAEFLYQIYRKRPLRWKVFSEGLYLLAKGYFLKCGIGDNLGTFVDANWSSLSLGASAGAAWVVTIAFALQIFCDFEGYSTIARGLAYIFGFRFPKNFNFPYLASSFKNFWERWHITLSTWFRDYVYIPLGGNRGGAFLTNRNLLLTMLIAGLWHGASWTFVIWGLLHGILLCVERAVGMHRRHLPWYLAVSWRVVVALGVLYTWVWFRATGVADAMAVTRQMVTIGGAGISIPGAVWLLAGVVAFMHICAALVENGRLRPPSIPLKAALAGVYTFLALSWHDGTAGFIYFQF